MSIQQTHPVSSPLNVRWRGYRVAAWVGLAILAIAIIVVLLGGRYTGAMTLAGFLIASGVFVWQEERLPNLFDLLFVIAALVNAVGWVWNLFESPGLYDEITHTYTIFAITLALGWLTYGSLFDSFRNRRWQFTLVIASFGLAIGAVWEIGEWTAEQLLRIDVISGLDDTIIDLIVDALGALLAGAVSVWALGKSR